MDKVLERIGAYDLIGILVAGVCMTASTIVVDNIFLQYGVEGYLPPMDSLAFAVISYLVGMVFFEASSWFQNAVFPKKNWLIEHTLKNPVSPNIRLPEDVLKTIRHCVSEHTAVPCESLDNRALYEYCKTYLQATHNFDRADTYQGNMGFSRSMTVYCFVLELVIVNRMLCSPWDPNLLAAAILAACLTILFSHRFLRIVQARYLYIFRSYYSLITMSTPQQ